MVVRMTRLNEADLRKMLGLLRAAGEVEGPQAFPAPVLDALRELVPCDVVAFHERSGGPARVLVWAGEPVGEMTEAIREARRRLRHEDPVRPVAGARTLSDFIRMREFRRSDFYNLVHRPLGIEQMLSLYLEPRAKRRALRARPFRIRISRSRPARARIAPPAPSAVPARCTSPCAGGGEPRPSHPA
jgi:hypothetical protein